MSKNLYKNPKLYEAFDLYCQWWCDELPTDEELSDITFSPSFEERMRLLLRRQKYGYYVLFGTAWRSAASVLVAILVSMSIATFSVRALREPVVRFITEVFETFTNVLFVDDEPASPQNDMDMKTVVPAYIPEGYAVQLHTSSDKMIYRVVYYNADTSQRIYYIQSRNNSGLLTADTEDVIIHSVNIGAVSGIAYQNKSSFNVVFAYGEYTYSVSGPLSEEELLRIAESIPLK